MRYFVLILGIMFFLAGGVAMLAIVRSDVETVVVLMAFGFGAACLGLFGVIDVLMEIRDRLISSGRPGTSA